jgi:hypothetical protein
MRLSLEYPSIGYVISDGLESMLPRLTVRAGRELRAWRKTLTEKAPSLFGTFRLSPSSVVVALFAG